MKYIDPIVQQINIKNVKQISNRQIIIETANEETETTCGTCVQVVCIFQNYENTITQQWILCQNKEFIDDKPYEEEQGCQASLQVDLVTYTKLLRNGNLHIGLDSCRIYDA